MAKTIPCKNCGEVIFKINTVCESSEVICQTCKKGYNINCGEYTAYENTCKSCCNESFKLRRYDYEDREIIKIECSNCKDEPNTYYVDKEGKKIDRSIREILMIKDSIERVENIVYNLESRVDDIDCSLENMEWDISNIRSKANVNKESIDNIEYDVNDIKGDISSIEYSISNLRSDISSVESSIYSLERNY